MLSNSRTVALLTPEADVVWMCHPQADSAAVFSRLLGDATAGHFAIGPQREALPLSQRYVDWHYDRRNPLGQPACHRLPVARRRRGPHRLDPCDQRAGQGGGRVRAAARVRAGARPPARRRRRSAGVRDQRSDGVAVTRREVGDRCRTGSTRPRGPSSTRREGPCVFELRCGTEDLTESPVDDDSRRERAESYWSDWVSDAGAAVAETGADEAVGADAARAGACRHRRDHGGGHHVAARGDRRRPQLGLPLLLDPRRRDDRLRAGVAGLDRRGRGISELAARCDRDDARARAAAPAVRAVGDDPRSRGGDRLAARLRGFASRAGRQRRQCPSAAGRFRPCGAADLRPVSHGGLPTAWPTR